MKGIASTGAPKTLLGGWVGGWMDGWESRVKDFLQQSKIEFFCPILPFLDISMSIFGLIENLMTSLSICPISIYRFLLVN
jgi:hypothetical protein